MTQTLKILHLEDTPSDAEMVERELRKGKILFDKELVSNKPDFIRSLQTFAPDIILSDHSLPSFDSHEALALVKKNGDPRSFHPGDGYRLRGIRGQHHQRGCL